MNLDESYSDNLKIRLHMDAVPAAPLAFPNRLLEEKCAGPADVKPAGPDDFF